MRLATRTTAQAATSKQHSFSQFSRSHDDRSSNISPDCSREESVKPRVDDSVAAVAVQQVPRRDSIVAKRSQIKPGRMN